MAVESQPELPLLGMLPQHWRAVEFGAVLDGGTRNGVYKPKEFHGTGDKIVNMGELFAHPRLFAIPMKRVKLSDKEQQRFRLQVGDLLFARRSLVAEGAGKCSIVCELNEPTTFESSIIRARPDPKIADSFYLYYLFCSPYGAYILDSILRHVAVAGITGTDLVKLQIPLPPLPQQKAIAHILGTLDDKIELNQQMNRNLEAIAQAIFKSWFVDFDPVRAKMEGRQPAGINAATAALFPDSFEDSQLGKIPKGWKVELVKNITEVTDYVANGSFATLKQNVRLYDEPEYALYIRTTDFKNDFSGRLKYTNYESYEFLRKSRLYGEEVIISNVGDTGTVFRPPVWLEKPMTLGSNAIVLKSTESSEFLVHYFSSFPGQKDILSIVSGSAQPKFNKTDFRALKLVIPSQKLLLLFNELARVNWQRQVTNYSNNRTLIAIRNTLLSKLMSGEIRVKEAEEILEVNQQ